MMTKRSKKLPARLRTFRLTARERQQLAERDELIAGLGMLPEDRTSYDSRYVASTGELALWVLEDRGLPVYTFDRIGDALRAVRGAK